MISKIRPSLDHSRTLRRFAVLAWTPLFLFAVNGAHGLDLAKASGSTREGSASHLRIAQADDAVDFASDVWPIFLNRCIHCHGPEKQRGEFRLDSAEAIAEGGELGSVITPGDPEDSFLYELVTLPPDHDDVMPDKGDPLTAEEQETLRRWILSGASTADWEPDPTVIAKVVAEKNETSRGTTILDELALDLAPLPEDAFEEINRFGAVAMPLDMKTPLARANFQLMGKKVGDDDLRMLAPLTQHLTWLNLGGTSVTDSGLAALTSLEKLTRLHLEKTNIGDDGLAHLSALKHLEYLNLYGTQVTDDGLIHLEKLENLRKLFLWQSHVSHEGAERLQAVLPELDINLGWETAPEVEEKNPDRRPLLSVLFDAGSCCDEAHKAGEECDHDCCKAAAAGGKVCTKCNPAAKAKAADLFP